MRPIPQAAIDLVKDQEETVLFVYDDDHYPPHPALPGDKVDGHLTAGTGHTGLDVIAGMDVTQAMNDNWLQSDLALAENRIRELIGAVIDELTENQLSALLDFVLNLGAKSSWTIWKRLKNKQFDQVPLELQKFVNITKKDGTVVKSTDLVNRRAAEIKLWSTGEPGIETAKVPSSVTRQAATTPPTPADPTKPSRSKAIIGGIAGAVTAGPAVCDDVINHLNHYADYSHYVGTAISVLAGIGAVCVGVSLFYTWVNKKDARN